MIEAIGRRCRLFGGAPRSSDVLFLKADAAAAVAAAAPSDAAIAR